MLNKNKTIVINATSVTDAGESIASMHCEISSGGIRTETYNIVRSDLYAANKTLAHADKDAFTTLCREEEDKFLSETTES